MSNHLRSRRSKASLVLVLACVASAPMMAPQAEAAGRGERSAKHPSASSGNRKNVHVDHDRADVRTRNVRNTSVNHVNVDRDVNINVDHHHDHDWDDDYHPIATAAAVAATVAVTSAVVGSIVRSVPAGCVPVNYGGFLYQQCGGVWYQPQGTQYIVVNAPY